MKSKFSELARRLIAFVVVVAATACSTVIKTVDEPSERAATAERAALTAAAAEVSWTPWPKPEELSLAERVSGVVSSGDRMTRDDAIEVYLATLGDGPSAERALFAHAERHLAAAREMQTAVELACDAPGPRLSDVAVIETSISSLRQTRSIYASALKELDADDDRIKALKEEFDSVVKDLGEAADTLAELAMKRSSQNIAGPAILKFASDVR